MIESYDDMVQFLQKEKGIYSHNLLNMFYAKQVRPSQFPKTDEQLKYVHNNFDEFKSWVWEYFGIDYKEKTCNKRPLTEYASRRALATCILSWDGKRKEKRRYFCKECQAWHLTSKPNKNL